MDKTSPTCCASEFHWSLRKLIFEKHKNNSDAEKYLSKSKLETVTKIGHALLKKKNTGVLPEKQEKLWVWTNPKLIAHLEELKGMTAGEKKRLAGEKQHLKNAEKKASAARGLKAGSASQQKRTPGKGKVKTPAAASKKVAATRGAKGKTNYRYNALKSRLAIMQARLQDVNQLVKVKNPSLLLKLNNGKGSPRSRR